MRWAASWSGSCTPSYWEDTVIFVAEDDAQSGSDHVDSHPLTGVCDFA
jgi:hypothetical protein